MTKVYKQMKIAVASLSGNVGKSTLSGNLLRAFRPGVEVIAVETQNNDDALNIEGMSVEHVSAGDFRHIYTRLMESDDLILDIGSSNFQRFMDELAKNRGSVEEIDLFVIPTTEDGKQQKDAYRTVIFLRELGVPASKIRVVFNQYDGADGRTVAHQFAHIIGFSMDDGKDMATWLPHVVVNKSEIYEMVLNQKRSVRDVADDKTDWRAARRAAREVGDRAAGQLAMDGQIAHGLSLDAIENLEQAYIDLMAPYMVKASVKRIVNE